MSMRPIWAVSILFAAIMLPINAADADDTAQKLSGTQIRAKFAGMEMTDGAHWADVYERNGTLRSFSMGSKTVGKWRVQKDELCVDLGDDPASGSGCYEVWLSKEDVELRPTESGTGTGLQGILRKPNVNN